jgi:hypothetical protein
MYVVDTHALIWYLLDDKKPKFRIAFALTLNPSPSGRGTFRKRFAPLLPEGEGAGG